MTLLYHFTCDHGIEGIRRLGYVGVNYHPLLGLKLAWFTDLEAPDRDAVGLTSSTLSCDRMAYRVTVDADACRPWLGSAEQALTPPLVQADLHRFSQPEHWWISRSPVSVEGDQP